MLLIHLMSAGRLQLFDKRAGLRDRTLAPAGPARRRPRAAAARVRHEAGGVGEAAARRGARGRRGARDARAGGVARPAAVRPLLGAQPRPLHALLRDQRVIAGIGRSWVDEILWTAQLSPFKRGDDLSEEEAGRAARGDGRAARRRDRRTTRRRVAADPRQAAAAAAGPPPPGRAVPALRHDARGGPLRGLRDVLLPDEPDRRHACSRTAGSRGC